MNQTVTRRRDELRFDHVFQAHQCNKPLGAVELIAGTYRKTARIVGFTARNVDAADAPVMNDFGDAAKLKFTVNQANAQVVVGA